MVRIGEGSPDWGKAHEVGASKEVGSKNGDWHQALSDIIDYVNNIVLRLAKGEDVPSNDVEQISIKLTEFVQTYFYDPQNPLTATMKAFDMMGRFVDIVYSDPNFKDGKKAVGTLLNGLSTLLYLAEEGKFPPTVPPLSPSDKAALDAIFKEVNDLFQAAQKGDVSQDALAKLSNDLFQLIFSLTGKVDNSFITILTAISEMLEVTDYWDKLDSFEQQYFITRLKELFDTFKK